MALKNNFKIKIFPRAKDEIIEIADYYESIKEGLGKRFYKEFRKNAETLKHIPFFFVRYNIIRILPIKKFPYTIHFSVDEIEKIVSILAITSDSQDPNTTKVKP